LNLMFKGEIRSKECGHVGVLIYARERKVLQPGVASDPSKPKGGSINLLSAEGRGVVSVEVKSLSGSKMDSPRLGTGSTICLY
jgi:hypothetical protein